MATDHDAFLAAIHADPDDLTARLVYADWLDEQGDPAGELVRLLCEERVNSYGKGSAWKRLERLCGGLAEIAKRLDERQRRHLALDFAEHVLPFFVTKYPRDGRLSEVIKTCREFARESTTRDLDARAGELVSLEVRVSQAAVFCGSEGRSGTPDGGAARYAALAADAAVMETILREEKRVDRIAKGAAFAEWAAYDAAEAHGQPGQAARDAEKSWQLCRAVEYLLGFIPPEAIVAPD